MTTTVWSITRSPWGLSSTFTSPSLGRHRCAPARIANIARDVSAPSPIGSTLTHDGARQPPRLAFWLVNVVVVIIVRLLGSLEVARLCDLRYDVLCS